MKEELTHEERIEIAKKSEYGCVYFGPNGPIKYCKDGTFGPYQGEYAPYGEEIKKCLDQ